MPRFQQRNFRSSGSRPNRTWAQIHNAAVTTVATSSKILLGQFVAGTSGIDETILRTRGTFCISQSAPETSDRVLIGAIGMCLVSDNAVAAGVASLPGPITDADDDLWMVWQSFCMTWVNVGTPATLVVPFPQHVIDSKAKRILTQGRQMALVVENASAANAFDIVFNVRSLAQVRGTR